MNTVELRLHHHQGGEHQAVQGADGLLQQGWQGPRAAIKNSPGIINSVTGINDYNSYIYWCFNGSCSYSHHLPGTPHHAAGGGTHVGEGGGHLIPAQLHQVAQVSSKHSQSLSPDWNGKGSADCTVALFPQTMCRFVCLFDFCAMG